MAKRTPKKKSPKKIETFTHDEASRKNIPTAEYQSVMRKEEQSTRISLTYLRYVAACLQRCSVRGA